MTTAERDWMRPEPPPAHERMAQVVRLLGAEPAFDDWESAWDVGFRGWWDREASRAVEAADLQLAGTILSWEREVRARQVGALERLGWALAGRAGSPSEQALGMVEAAGSPNPVSRERALMGVRALVELGWLAPAPVDPWPALRDAWRSGDE